VDRNAGGEEGLADELPPAARDLDDDPAGLRQRGNQSA
jgi:hypothetical protein